MDNISLLRRDDFRTRIGNDLYVIESYEKKGLARRGFFIQKNERKARLLVRMEKDFLPLRFPGWSYNQERPAQFNESTRYFLSLDKQLATEVRLNKRGIFGLLPMNKDKAEAFAKKNKNKLKPEEELDQVLTYYNSL